MDERSQNGQVMSIAKDVIEVAKALVLHKGGKEYVEQVVLEQKNRSCDDKCRADGGEGSALRRNQPTKLEGDSAY